MSGRLFCWVGTTFSWLETHSSGFSDSGTEPRVTETRTFIQENNINLVLLCCCCCSFFCVVVVVWSVCFSYSFLSEWNGHWLLSPHRKTQNIMTSFRRQWPHFSQSAITHISLFFPLRYTSNSFSFILFFPSFLTCVWMWIYFLFYFSFPWICRSSVSLYKILVLVRVRFWKCHFLLSLSTAARISVTKGYTSSWQNSWTFSFTYTFFFLFYLPLYICTALLFVVSLPSLFEQTGFFPLFFIFLFQPKGTSMVGSERNASGNIWTACN